MRGSILTFLIFINFLPVVAQTPVLLRVVATEQHDTLGCNIVDELTRLAYEEILSGRAKLWDSPEKEIQITGITLREIEKASQSAFIAQPVIYIYEYWTGSGKSLRSVTKGISFANKSKSGEEVSYGYLDFKDVQDKAFNATVSSNANGYPGRTLAWYLSGKQYKYHIMQYGAAVVDNITSSEKIKMDLTGGKGYFPNVAASNDQVPQKLVSWVMDADNNADAQKYMHARRFINAMEDYFKENREIFFNNGGDRIYTHVDDISNLKVTRMEVYEIWKKIDNQVLYDPVSVNIYVNDSLLNPVLYRDMIKTEIKVGMKSWVDVIREKQFPFIILKINDQVIKRSDSFLYFKALNQADWSKLTEFVKYY